MGIFQKKTIFWLFVIFVFLLVIVFPISCFLWFLISSTIKYGITYVFLSFLWAFFYVALLLGVGACLCGAIDASAFSSNPYNQKTWLNGKIRIALVAVGIILVLTFIFILQQ